MEDRSSRRMRILVTQMARLNSDAKCNARTSLNRLDIPSRQADCLPSKSGGSWGFETGTELFADEARRWRALHFASESTVDWFNNRRLLEPIGNIPPAEY